MGHSRITPEPWGDSRTFVIRYALLRLIPDFDDITAMKAATPTESGGRKKKSMAPSDNRVGVPMPSEYLERIKSIMPEGMNMSQMTRYALYRLQEWDHDDALEAALDYTRRRNQRETAA